MIAMAINTVHINDTITGRPLACWLVLGWCDEARLERLCQLEEYLMACEEATS